MKIAVTGAHGFVGSHVVDAARRDGHPVMALVSPWGTLDRLAAHASDDAVEIRRGDVTEPASLAGVFDGCDAVVHAAARVRDFGRWETFERVNVDGTSAVVAEATAAGIRRIVFVSSVAVWRYSGIRGDDPRERPRDEDRLPYGRSKALGEDIVTRDAAEPVIVRPALWPYGRRDATLARIVRALERRILPLVDGGDARLQTVDVAFLARVLVAVCHHPSAVDRSYLVADEGSLSWRELFDEMASILGVPPPRLVVPGALARAVAPAIEAAWVRSGLPGEPPLTRYRAGLMRDDVVFDASSVRDELGLRPHRSRAAALRTALTGSPS